MKNTIIKVLKVSEHAQQHSIHDRKENKLEAIIHNKAHIEKDGMYTREGKKFSENV